MKFTVNDKALNFTVERDENMFHVECEQIKFKVNAISSAPSGGNFRLLEDSGFRLLEDGSKRLLE